MTGQRAVSLLALSSYKPKGHDLEERLKKCALYDARFASVIPTGTGEEKRLFKLLCEACIGASYLKRFSISREEVDAIALRVRALRDLVLHACESRIAELTHA